MLTARPADPAQPREIAGQVLGQPVTNQVSEFLIGHAGLPLPRQPSKHRIAPTRPRQFTQPAIRLSGLQLSLLFALTTVPDKLTSVSEP